MSATTIGVLLAVAAAVALNGSYVMQHVGSAPLGPVDARRPLRTLGTLLRSPLWALGAIAGFSGWALHIAAMREAPLSLVQAFVAGGLAIAVPMAAFALRRGLDRREAGAVGLMVVALVLLSLGLHATSAHAAFSSGGLLAAIGVLGAAAALLVAGVHGARRPLVLGIAGGLLYGAADLALKAVTGEHGSAIVTRPWLWLGIAATCGAFFAFQRGLQSARPVAVIALMTAATNVTSILGAFAIYGDSLGGSAALRAAHAVGFVLVIVAGWRLAPAVTLAPYRAERTPTAAGRRSSPVRRWRSPAPGRRSG